MLVLSRKIGEVITIGNSITVTVLGFDRGFVKLGIEAPQSVTVHRKEIYDKIIEVNRSAATTELTALRDAIQASGLFGLSHSGDVPAQEVFISSEPSNEQTKD